MSLSGWRSPMLLAIFTLVLMLGLFVPWVHGIDGTGYYAWLRSAVIDGDLDTADEYGHFDRLEPEWKNRFSLAPTGRYANPFPIGPAMLWSPAFLVAHVLAPLLGYPRDGYSPPYIWAISLASVMFVLVGLLLLLQVARRWASPAAALWGIVAVWLASPLIFYQYAHPSMSHAADVLVNCFVVWWWSRMRIALGRPWPWFVLGLAIGVAGCVRPQNLWLAAASMLGSTMTFISDQRPQSRDVGLPRIRGVSAQRGARLASPILASFVPLVLGLLLGFAPQLLVWWYVFGTPLIDVREAAYGSPHRLDLRNLHLVEVLFSSNRGLFVWSPLLLPASLAWLTLWRYDRHLSGFLLVNALGQLVVVAAFPNWSGGASFGARLLLGLIPFWGLNLAAGFEWLRRRGTPAFAFAFVSGAFAVWNVLLLAQYALNLLPRAGPVDLGAMVANQWGVIDRIFAYVGRGNG
jgi:hypothetical protein